MGAHFLPIIRNIVLVLQKNNATVMITKKEKKMC
jgi:hypothetical protein